MHYRILGRTGLPVSALSFGTVSLGVDYGIVSPSDYGQPSSMEALRLLRRAAEEGVTLFDTAPAYGESERLLGEALARERQCIFATKVTVPRSKDGSSPASAGLRATLFSSLESSLRNLRRESLDIVQIHNATLEMITRGEVAESLLVARQKGMIRYLGASVYTEAEALAVIDAGCFDLLQLPCNILDQRPLVRVLAAARDAGVGILSRSVLLKGVLSPKACWLPAELEELRLGAQRVVAELAGSWEELPATALRFCLSLPEVATVLIGARTGAELTQALTAEESGPLSPVEMAQSRHLAMNGSGLLNPATWPLN